MLTSHLEVISLMMNHSKLISICLLAPCIFGCISYTCITIAASRMPWIWQVCDEGWVGEFSLLCWCIISTLSYLEWRFRHLWSCEKVFFFPNLHIGINWPTLLCQNPFEELICLKNRHRIRMCQICLLFAFRDLMWIVWNHPKAIIAFPITSNFIFNVLFLSSK